LSARENTPEAPGKSGDGQGSQKPTAKPADQGEPRSPGRESDATAQNEKNSPPRALETARIPPAGDAKDRWGDLPVQVRQVFRSDGDNDLPPQYRDWIDAYYRRLQQQR
jgi:hypothetical protein